MNPSTSTFNTAQQSYKFVSYSGVFNPGASSAIYVTFETAYGGTSNFWTVNGLDVRPLGLIGRLSLHRVGGNVSTTADGLSVDTYTGTGAVPYSEVTISPQYGSPGGTDVDPAMKGYQVRADATGIFTAYLLRPTGTGSMIAWPRSFPHPQVSRARAYADRTR